MESRITESVNAYQPGGIMKTTTMQNGVGNNNFYTEDSVPPLSAAFAVVTKSSGNPDGQPVEKEEETWFEGAD